MPRLRGARAAGERDAGGERGLRRETRGEGEPGRVPRRPLRQQERQGEAGSEEGACAPILQQPSKDKAESERERVRGEGGCGERQERGVTLETLGNWHLTLRGPGRLRRVRTAAVPHCSQSSLAGAARLMRVCAAGTPKTCGTAALAEKRICCSGSQSLHDPGPSHASWAERPLHGSHICLASWLGFALPPVHTPGLSTCWAPARRCLGSVAATHLPQGLVCFPGPAPQPPGPKPTQLGLVGSPEPSSQRDSLSSPHRGVVPPQPSPGHLGELCAPLPPAHSPGVPLHVTSGLGEPPSLGLASQGCRMWVFLWVL